jgi:signal transduction histidine kinase
MKRLMPDTIAARTTAVMLVSLLLFYAVSIYAYHFGVNSEIDLTNEVRLAERLSTIKRAIARLPVAEREQIAHSLSGGPLEVHWSNVPLTVDRVSANEKAAGLRARLLEVAPEIGADGLLMGAPSPVSDKPEDPHLLLVSMRLVDSSWVNFSITTLSGPRTSFFGIILSTSLLALTVIGLSLLVLRTVTNPVQRCAEAVKRLYVDAEPHAIEVTGPREVRELAVAFNELQQRVKSLVDDRTLMLAAISHDLKTPLTRTQLRIEDIDSAELRQSIDADLAEMRAMIDSSLDFLKGDRSGEPVRDVELTAILESVRDDLCDTGHAVQLNAESKLVVRGRHLALKRAFANLLTNAARFGSHVEVTVRRRDGQTSVTIDDDGPGVPPDQREAVFAPFYRLEMSRNRETGGVGLGLTVARSIIRGHGGDVVLDGAPSGGLRVVVSLPSLRLKETGRKQKAIERKSA